MHERNEIWKSIPTKNSRYQYEISNTGKVRSIRKNGIVILKPWLCDGYYYVHLGRENKRVHRLVAEAFIPNPKNYPCVNHKDYIRTNNNIENLEWCDKQYNAMYSHERFQRPKVYRGGKSGEKYIFVYGKHTYRVQIRSRNGLYYNKSFSDMETAIKHRDAFLEEIGYA